MRTAFRACFCVFLVCCALVLSSCTKESSPTQPGGETTATGTWGGAYSHRSSSGALETGTISFVLVQNDGIVTGTYSAVSSAGESEAGTVKGLVLQAVFQGRMVASADSCTITNTITGTFSGYSSGASFSAMYMGGSSCGPKWIDGQLNLSKQ